jgi:hypothetical protein
MLPKACVWLFELARQWQQNPKSRRNGCGWVEGRASQIFVWREICSESRMFRLRLEVVQAKAGSEF